jgi:exopolysaccharide production protein ExoQ
MLVLLALWCLMSFAWSDYPSLTVRYGIQFCLTVAIALALSYRLAPMTFIKILFVASSLAGLASLLSGRARGDGMGYLGIYASKNALANASALLVILALSVLIDRRLPWRWRLPALASLLVGALLLLLGKSTGALVATLAVIGAFGVIMLLQRLTPLARLVTVTLALVLAAAAGVLLSFVVPELSKWFLNATGKDVTLTGRTDLWAAAFHEIAERPALGVGFQAFWVHGQPLAEQLWAMFGIAGRSGFNFHNTLISNAVEIGLIGAALQAVIFFGGLAASLSWAIRSPSAASVFFALFMVRQFMLMWIEAAYFYQFELSSVITIAAVCYGRGFRRTQRVPAQAPMARGGRPGLPAVT